LRINIKLIVITILDVNNYHFFYSLVLLTSNILIHIVFTLIYNVTIILIISKYIVSVAENKILNTICYLKNSKYIDTLLHYAHLIKIWILIIYQHIFKVNNEIIFMGFCIAI